MAVFRQLVHAQGGRFSGDTPLVYEDAAMALCLQGLGLLELEDGPGSTGSSAASSSAAATSPSGPADARQQQQQQPSLRSLAGEPPVGSMLRRLHA